MCAKHLEEVSLNAEMQFRVFGDRTNFALELRHRPGSEGEAAPEESAGSWGEWRLWVADINLCELRLDTENGTIEAKEVRWFMAPLFRWIVENWKPLLHEKRLPPGGRLGENRLRSARAAYLAMLESAGDDFDRFSLWQQWALRHSLRATSEGGILPDVFFQRMEDEIELSWGDRVQPGADAATFVVEDGISRASVDKVADALYSAVEWFLELQEVRTSQWGQALKERWDETGVIPAGISALSWYLDSSPEPQVLTNTFTNALQKFGRSFQPSERSWLGRLSPEVAMFGDLAPDISEAAAATLLAEYFDAEGDANGSDELTRLMSEEPAWAASSPWSNGYSLAQDVLDAADPAPEAAMTKVEDLLNNLGVEVRNVNLGEKGPRGVALAGENLRPTILVNQDNFKNKYRGRRFTLAHELGHILFDQSRARPLAHSSTPWASPPVEQRANAFAAMLLMPPSRVKRPVDTNLKELKHGIGLLADRLQVSRVALKRHLSNLDMISPHERDYLLGTQSHEL